MQASSGESRFRWYLFLAAFLVLPNLFLLLAARPISLLVRGYINLDYLLIALLSLFVPRIVTFILLIVAVALDFTYAACITYFFAPAEFFHVLRYGGFLSTTRISLIVAALIGALVVCLAAAVCTSPRAPARQRRIAFVAILVAFLGLTLADLPGLFHALSRTDLDAAYRRITRTPALGLLRSQYIYDHSERGLRVAGMYAMPSAVSLALNHLPDYPAHDLSAGSSDPQVLQPNLVLVLVEAWGLARDPALRHAMAEPLSSPQIEARYQVLSGTMPFAGPTTSGEKRELCQSYMGMVLEQGTQAQLNRCVPPRMHRAGYRTLAVHGFNGDFFNRKDWYPRLDFDDIWFHDRLQAAGLPDCEGPFPGSCDDAVAKWLAGRLRERGNAPLFVHWVTLNSHLPLWESVVLKWHSGCDVSAITRSDAAICAWYDLVSIVNKSVRDLALGPLGRPTIFVVVGDHAPPFDKDSERAEFSTTQVPWFILLPKTGAAK
jgi:hypothetical protein